MSARFTLPRTLRRAAATVAVTTAAVAGAAVGPAAAAGPPPAPTGAVVRVATGAPPGSTVFGHLTAVNPTGNGVATVFTCGDPLPPTLSLIYNQGVTSAAFAAARTDSQGAVCVHTSMRTHLLFDVEAATKAVSAQRGTRTLDTRTGTQPGAGSVTRIKTSAPPGTVVAGTLSATAATRPGWLAAYACDTARPQMSSVSYGASGRASNFVAVRADANSNICVYTSSPSHILFDQTFTSTALVPAPARVLDTRTGSSAPVPAGTVVRVHAGTGPGTVWGVLTAVPSGARAGWLAAYPCDTARPVASAVNFAPNTTTAGFVAVRTDTRGDFCVYTSTPSHILFDRAATSATVTGVPVRKLDTRTDWAGASQLVTVTVASKTSVRANIAYWERGNDGKFRTVRSTSQGWVGELGIGQGQWGVPRTPEGAYNLTETFGLQPNPGTRMPYFQVDQFDWWDGDPNSSTYNSHVRKSWVAGEGSEHLIDIGYAYNYAAFFDYNPERNPERGSAFFFHVSTNEPTGGCVSAPIGDVSAILRAIDPAKSPAIMIGQGAWGTYLADRTWAP